jgi:starch synthase (maltosyl-transferring)
MQTLMMEPATGERWLRYVGDRLRFVLRRADGGSLPAGWRAWVRTTIGRGTLLRGEIIASRGGERPRRGLAWRDLPMRREGEEWVTELALTEVGFFHAKAYAVDERGWQVWPDGEDFGVTVHPDVYRSGNTIYCAFTRLFGSGREAVSLADRALEARLSRLEQQGFAVLPRSGTLRDVRRALPHVIDTLGCRILHLLPVNPTPTTYARFGRMGSPYAGLDLTAIDPALIEFDRRTTGVEQFGELTRAVHERGARLLLDLAINHTGWSSTLHERHPEWFLRNADGTFESPGAWGVTWEDLIDLDESQRALWDVMADAFLTWCRRGVDGFRCDAGYKVPPPVWEYIVARVREEFPDALFLLEGLGGAWELTEGLLTDGGMQWAYSELFQEYSGLQVSGYLDHALKQSARVGTLIHYSETHDNERLAKKGRGWALLRNRLCALTSVSGGFGFTCGVEWLAREKIRVHDRSGLAWGHVDNLLPELSRLNQLLTAHPAFLDGVQLTRLSAPGAPVYVLRRDAPLSADCVLVLVNTESDRRNSAVLPARDVAALQTRAGNIPLGAWVDLLMQPKPELRQDETGNWVFRLAPGACHCLAATVEPFGMPGDEYRRVRAQTAWAIQVLGTVLDPELLGQFDWARLGTWAAADPVGFVGSVGILDREQAAKDLMTALESAHRQVGYRPVVVWERADASRITLVPEGHWLVLQDQDRFRATLRHASGAVRHVESVSLDAGPVACFPPRSSPGDAALTVERYASDSPQKPARVRFVSAVPHGAVGGGGDPELVLLANGAGAMARLAVDLGSVTSKYDCLLGANLHPSVPVDRHVLAKRARVWANANGFLSPLDGDNVLSFAPGPPACWRFAAHAGGGQMLEVELRAMMVEGKNTSLLRFERPSLGVELDKLELRLTVRVDIEDRSFHAETKRNGGADHHFASHTRLLIGRTGFLFGPAADRQLRVFSDSGTYYAAPEWCERIPHPIEAGRGQEATGDAYSPGWFDLPLAAGGHAILTVTTESEDTGARWTTGEPLDLEATGAEARFERRLRQAIQAFVVRRGHGKTVIAGYPWFLDWGRDTLICGRGLLAAGMTTEVGEILATFGRFEDRGTLPNSIHGDDASNRDTSDAALWYGLLSEEYAQAQGDQALLDLAVTGGGRTVAEVLGSIARHHLAGTPNGIRMDTESALIWSPSHFTWMDTNHPACTPREGYPIEIQALWIRLLRQLERLGVAAEHAPWGELADRAEASLNRHFWIADRHWLADVLVAKAGTPASRAAVDDALRSNALLAVALGVVTGDPARSTVEAARRHLLVPGGVRSLAPLPLRLPLKIRGADGRLLSDPSRPYRGRYEGDEDTSRKPAYHNGTAWVWKLPVFCEAMTRAWNQTPEVKRAARAYLSSVEDCLNTGCAGHLPEVLDGDAPHAQRGCDAQAWSATEALRVWRWLREEQ